MDKEAFIQAIRDRHKVRLSFNSKEDNSVLVRTCAPMDYGPSTRAHEKNDRYHLWDYDSDTQQHTLSLNPEQVQKIEVLSETFDPAEFVTWPPQWIVSRDWGQHS